MLYFQNKFHSQAKSLAVGILMTTCCSSIAQAQSVVACPERVRTTEATLAQPAKATGFTSILGDEASQSFLQDVAVFSGPGEGASVKGTAKGPKRLEWTFDGQADVSVACVFEGGVTLMRSVGKVKTCAATINRSRGNKDAMGHGMESASFSCR
ncbi:MAG: STY0301 family protein [Beijerinckiaceae bacterium]